MFKNGYKVILIKEGKFNLRQFDITPMKISIFIGMIMALTSSLFIFFSDEFSEWAGSREIKLHRKNNKILIEKIKMQEEGIRNLIEQLEDIKKQDDQIRQLVKLPPIHEDIRKMGYGGSDKKSETPDLNYLLPESGFGLKYIEEQLDYLGKLMRLELLSYSEIESIINKEKDKILSYPAIFPVDRGAQRLSSNFGYRRDPFSGKNTFHGGHDFSAPIGTDVYASANGRVKKSKYWGSFGNYIEIDHGRGYLTVYGHLSSRNVKVGQKVIRGQKIGEVGNTGRSTAPHLHYEVNHYKKSLDPTQFYFDHPLN